MAFLGTARLRQALSLGGNAGRDLHDAPVLIAYMRIFELESFFIDDEDVRGPADRKVVTG